MRKNPANKDTARRECNQHIENLPDILTAQHIADYLGISRRRVYELFQIKPEFGGIKNFDLGAAKRCSKRAQKTDFLNWLNAKVAEKTKQGQA
ncbi:MAG: helix-turn-helix domain-containing protein [Sporomusaceae bacterium]|jgi:hypothetical protein|nr:helix-turn-helix domain-containing protein [Sporomusaceae bacterium]